jgi:hypothetical protein
VYALTFSLRKAKRQEEAMIQTQGAGGMTGKPLIESDRVEGTNVYDPAGKEIGSIKRLMIEKTSGKVVYAVMSFGGFLGMGEEEQTIPWNKLDYDTSLGGYRTDITEQQLRGAPSFSRDRDYEWSDRARERELHDYWAAPYYWSGV